MTCSWTYLLKNDEDEVLWWSVFNEVLWLFGYLIPGWTFIWRRIFSHKIEFAIDNLMMTIRMQGRMNTTINCQVKLISKNEINARQWVWDRWFGLCIAAINESMSLTSGDVMSSVHYDLEKFDKSTKSFKNWKCRCIT